MCLGNAGLLLGKLQGDAIAATAARRVDKETAVAVVMVRREGVAVVVTVVVTGSSV